ncbi:MAG: AsmA-like C-terminal region-containing protein [Pseudomonadota bacterium]
MRTRKRLIMVLTTIAALVLLVPVLAGLAITQLPALENLRKQTLERGLSLYWGEAVRISGPVEVTLWPRLVIRANEVTSTTDGTAPARAEQLRILLARWTRLPFEPPLFAIGVTRAHFQFALASQSNAAPGSVLSSPVAFFSILPRLRLDDVTFDVAAPEDGWEFVLKVDHVLSRLRDGIEFLEADARLNDRPIAFKFQFDREPQPDAPLHLPYGAVLSLTSGSLAVQMTTRSATAAFDDELVLETTASTSSIADLLSIAGIARTVDGTAELKGQILSLPQRLAIRDLVLESHFAGGTTSRITGGIDDLSDWTGVDIKVEADMSAAGTPADATSPDDVAITRMDGHFRDGPEGLMLADATVDTNAFSQSLQEIGPITVDAIRRDEAGHLSLKGINLKANPGPKPLFHLRGDIQDVLGWSGIALDGTFDLPLSDILSVPAPAKDMLGRLSGTVSLADPRGSLEIRNLEAQVKGGALTATVRLDPAPQGSAAASALDLTLKVPRLGPLMEALGTPSSFDGALSYDGSFQRGTNGATARGTLILGETDVKGALTATARPPRIEVSGELTSNRIAADQVLALFEGLEDAARAPNVKFAGATLKQGVQPQDLARRTDLDIALKAERVEGIGRTATGLTARLHMDEGRFRADPVSLSLGAGRIKGALTAMGDGRFGAKGTGEGWPLSDLVGPSAPFSISGTASFSFDVTAGIAPADPVRTLDGSLTARIHNGRLGTGMLDLAGLGLLGGIFNPAVLSGETHLRCVLIPLKIEKGVAQTSPAIVLETDNVEADAHGKIDLPRGTISLSVVPRPLNGGAGSEGYPFTISGPLSSPKVDLGAARAHAHPRRAAECRN